MLVGRMVLGVGSEHVVNVPSRTIVPAVAV